MKDQRQRQIQVSVQGQTFRGLHTSTSEKFPQIIPCQLWVFMHDREPADDGYLILLMTYRPCYPRGLQRSSRGQGRHQSQSSGQARVFQARKAGDGIRSEDRKVCCRKVRSSDLTAVRILRQSTQHSLRKESIRQNNSSFIMPVCAAKEIRQANDICYDICMVFSMEVRAKLVNLIPFKSDRFLAAVDEPIRGRSEVWLPSSGDKDYTGESECAMFISGSHSEKYGLCGTTGALKLHWGRCSASLKQEHAGWFGTGTSGCSLITCVR